MLRAIRSPLVVALGALGLVLLGMEARWPGFFLHDDNASWFAGAYAHDFRTLTETGRIAEVNFFQYGGEPFVEQGQTAVLYPPVYLAAALASIFPGDLRATVDWLAALHLALGLAGFYFWTRRGGIDPWLAALGGLVWVLNPFVLLLGASWVMVTAAVAWLPWLFWGIDLIVAPGGTPPGCGSLFGSNRGGSAHGEPGALDSRLRMGQASGLPGGSGEADEGVRGSPVTSCARGQVPGHPDNALSGPPSEAGSTGSYGTSPNPAPGGRGLPLQAGSTGGGGNSPGAARRLPGDGPGDESNLNRECGQLPRPAPGTHVSRGGLPSLADPTGSGGNSPSPAPGGRGLPLLADPTGGGGNSPGAARGTHGSRGGVAWRAVALGGIAGMLVLQGYVQWAAYAFLFGGVYAAGGIFLRGREHVAPDGQEPAAEIRSPVVRFLRAARVRATSSPDHPANGGGYGTKLAGLGLAGLVAGALAMPQVWPLLRGAAESKARAQELSPMFELFYRVEPGDLLAAQVGWFREHFLFGASTALFFCPALVLFPVALVAFGRGDEAARRRLFPLVLLAVLALVFSGRGYFLLNVVPFMAKFRWPFKVFLFAEFFLAGALVWGVAILGRWWEGGADEGVRGSAVTSCARGQVPGHPDNELSGPRSTAGPAGSCERSPSAAHGVRGLPFQAGSAGSGERSPSAAPGGRGLPLQAGSTGSGERSPSAAPGGRGLPILLLGGVIVLQLVVALGGHSGNLLSPAGLPARADLPEGIDPAKGRVVAVTRFVPEEAARFLSLAYGTFYEVPSLGGYDPLVSTASLDFSLGLDVPNVLDRSMTPEVRAALESRAVRYWMVEPSGSRGEEIAKLDGMRMLSADGEDASPALSGLGSPTTSETQGSALGYPVSPPWGSGDGSPASRDVHGANPGAREGTNTSRDFLGGRMIFEDTRAQPMAFDEAAPMVALPVRYAGNSMLIGLNGAAGVVAVSVGPAEGWWFRVDGADWKQCGYSDFRLRVPVPAGSKELEVSFFDSVLREGMCISLGLILILIFLGIWPMMKKGRGTGTRGETS